MQFHSRSFANVQLPRERLWNADRQAISPFLYSRHFPLHERCRYNEYTSCGAIGKGIHGRPDQSGRDHESQRFNKRQYETGIRQCKNPLDASATGGSSNRCHLIPPDFRATQTRDRKSFAGSPDDCAFGPTPENAVTKTSSPTTIGLLTPWPGLGACDQQSAKLHLSTSRIS